jgi:hypothetical protein
VNRGSLGDLTEWRGGFIASGCIHDSSGYCGQAIVVSSPDGRSWDPIEVDGTPTFGFGSLQRAGKRLFALGYGDIGFGGGAVVWTSVDGREWSRVRSDTFNARAIGQVINSPAGTFAFGYNAPPGSDNTSGFVIWPIHDDGSFGGVQVVDTSKSFRLNTGVVWTGAEFLAWGGRDGPHPSPSTLLLSSPDGTSWSARGEIRGERRISINQILAFGDRLIAVGSQRLFFPLKPRAWISNDRGRTWKSAEVEGDNAGISVVGLDGATLIARGFQSSTGDDGVAVSWISANGRSWTLLPRDQDLPAVEGFRGLAPVTIGERTCVAGTSNAEELTSAAIYCREAR